MQAILAIALAVVTAFGGLLPVALRLAGGPPPHVCHCEVRGGHAECHCPRCNPELRDDADDGVEVVRATCGDDDDTTIAKAIVTILSAPCAVRHSRTIADELPSLDPPRLAVRLRDGPDSPPPRTARA